MGEMSITLENTIVKFVWPAVNLRPRDVSTSISFRRCLLPTRLKSNSLLRILIETVRFIHGYSYEFSAILQVDRLFARLFAVDGVQNRFWPAQSQLPITSTE